MQKTASEEPGTYLAKWRLLSSLHTLGYAARGQLEKEPASKLEGPPHFEIVAFSESKPHMMTMSAENIRKGVYEEINALQGKHGIYWVSPAFHTHWIGKQWR